MHDGNHLERGERWKRERESVCGRELGERDIEREIGERWKRERERERERNYDCDSTVNCRSYICAAPRFRT